MNAIFHFVLFYFCAVIHAHMQLYFVDNSRERDLLSIPSNTGSLRLVQWPLFLLSSKVDVTWKFVGDRFLWCTVIEACAEYVIFSRSCWQ